MKKLLIFFITIGLIVSMTACGGDKKDNAQSNESGNDTKQTTVDKLNVSEPNEDGEVIIKDLAGKTLADAMDSGYHYVGYTALGGDYVELDLDIEATDSNVEKIKKTIEGMTIAELVEKYDINLGYMEFNGEYTFLARIGSIEFGFDLENGATAAEAHDDEFFFDLETAEEIQNDKPENVEVERINLVAELDEATSAKLIQLDDYDLIEEMADEIVFSKVYYTVE